MGSSQYRRQQQWVGHPTGETHKGMCDLQRHDLYAAKPVVAAQHMQQVNAFSVTWPEIQQ